MNTINNYNNSQIQFQGRFALRKLSQSKISTAMRTANMLSMPEQDIIDIAKRASDKKWSFFNHLTEKFNGINFYRKESDKENPAIVKEIFETVKKPHAEHFAFISLYNGSLNNIKRVFDSANNKEKLHFALRVNRDMLIENPQSNPNLIAELLESPNNKEYIKNYNKYKLYLQLNSENKNAVKELDDLVSNNKFEESIENIKFELRKKKYTFEDTENFNKELYVQKLNDDNESMIDTLQDIGLINNIILKNGGDKTLKEIFLTTNSKNIRNRVNLAVEYNKGTSTTINEKVHHLEMLNSIFQKMDNDKHINNFIGHIVKNLNANLSLNELDAIIDEISALKLDIFKKNATQIINNSKEGSRVETLKNEIENPFYESYSARLNRKNAERYGFRKKRSFLSKTMTRIQNQFKIWEYKLKSINENSVVAQNEINPVEVKPAEVTPINVAPDVIIPERTNVIENKTATIKENTSPESRESITPETNKKAQRAAAKAQVKQNIFDIIGSKLGLKTLEKQREAFGANATKMRLSLLSEIFASIADTRKADKAVGKLKINSSNKDVLDLYLLINGSNKKYINYLLKKRNADNTRMFEVKDIIASIRKAENKIAADKKANPNYRANDARKYYNHLYESKLQQYGKIKKSTKQVNTKA